MYVHIHPFGSVSSPYTFIQHEPKQNKLDPEATVVTVWTRVASKRKQEPALPIPLDLPHNFQPKIQEGLDQKNLTGRARAKFITSIAEAMYWFKSYPTKEEYDHVANQMVKKWPFLETRTGHVSTTLLYVFFYVLFTIMFNCCCLTTGIPCRSTKGMYGILVEA